jgi:adenylate kinase family enzyme
MASRVHILGASGSGVTTLGRAISEEVGCAPMDSDDYFWLPSDPPFQQTRSREERLALLRADLEQHDSWVLSGSLCGWGDPLIPLFDLVVFLWIPPETRLARLAERERRRYGEEALAPGGRMHKTHRTFMEWAASYDSGDLSMRSRQRHEQWMQALPCPVLRLEGEGTVAEHLREVVRFLDQARGQHLPGS